MDKNTLVGFGLIGAVLIGFTFLQRPSEKQLIAQKHFQDSKHYKQFDYGNDPKRPTFFRHYAKAILI